MKKESMFRCQKCRGESAPTRSLSFTQVHVGEDSFEAATTFQYLGDGIEECGSSVDATSSGITTSWKGLRQLLKNITNCGIWLRNWGNIFSSCIRTSLLYGCKTWAAPSEAMHRLTSADDGMICWICCVRIEQCIRTEEFQGKLGIIGVIEEI